MTAFWVALLQSDLIPNSVWEQIPVVVLFCLVFILIARYFFQFEAKRVESQAIENEKWRQLIQSALKDQRDASATLLQMMQAANKDVFAAFSQVQAEAFKEVFDEAILHISRTYEKGGNSERKPN